MEPNNPTQETTPEQYPQQQVTEQPIKQQGFLLPIVGVLLLLVIVGAGAYYLGTTKPSNKPTVENATPTPSIQPTFITNQNQPDTLKGLPIYPNAVFVEKVVVKPGDDPKCEPGNTSPACVYGSTYYAYSTKDSWKTVYEWYKNSSGWKLSGGGGAEGYSTSTLTKNEDKIQVDISEYPPESITKVTLGVSNNPQ